MLNVGVLQYGRGSRGIVVVALVLALVLLLVGGSLRWHGDISPCVGLELWVSREGTEASDRCCRALTV